MPGREATSSFVIGKDTQQPLLMGLDEAPLRSQGGPVECELDMDMDPQFTFKSRVEPSLYASVESLDYDVCENIVYRAEQANRTFLDNVVYGSLKWVLCLVTAVIVAAFGIIVNFCVENLAGTKFVYTFSIMEDSYFLSFCVYACFNCLLVLCASTLVVYWGPAAAGSGIPDVKAYLNGIDVPGVLLPKTLITKVTGCVCAVAGGLAVGKEGPFVHLGSCVAAMFTRGPPKYWKRKNKWLSMLANDRDRRDMVTCGGVAGVAAAFRSPVGGVLFALEESASWWNNSVLWRAFFTTAVVSVCLRIMMKWCGASNCGYFGSGGYIIFEISQGQVDYQLMELFPMLLLGLLGGVLGSTFNSVNTQLCLWRRDVLSKYGPSYRVMEAVIVAFITSLVSFGLPLMAPCRECPANSATPCPRGNADYGSYISFNCAKPNEYNDMATLFFNTQDNAIRALFSSNTDHEYSVTTLTLFFVFFFGLSILTYGVTVPSGLFVPSILCGASYGRLVGMLMTELNGTQDIDEGTYALLGAASFLGGAMRMTVSLCVILLELTNNLNLLPLVMLVLLVAKAVGDATGVHAVYDIHIELKKLPFIGSKAPHFMRHVTAGEAATPSPVCFQRVMPVRDLISVLQSTDHSGFPVFSRSAAADGEQEFIGLILRAQVLALLHERRCFQNSPKAEGPKTFVAAMNMDMARGCSVLDLPLSNEDLNCFVDLGPYCNPSTYVVQEGASLSKAYAQFRQLGLRHLVVVPKVTSVSGILTRKDLLPGMLERRFPELAGSHSPPSKLGVAALEKGDDAPGNGVPPWARGATLNYSPRGRGTHQRKVGMS
mmetsp:Transcript_11530/g.32699  ORF Transcript_11530/g.32699 Transcript_11530/m.32699 type:complete len:826 (+) Transcript_11530:309-2786(+)|eukprot:CAMPEP_0117667606 /NCGR_PEP_ID=MMETSP0804-20121206/11065_1 /TAXON_ID=1074897 /ORGANISM="Tetraselmis astigmatica, Strain CCMP880" /LENGTH=825 /DNA_ID=CAMNT_0005475361 /DNA_START=269 /DNA_END=2746 /DNA_ORIENTATION=+